MKCKFEGCDTEKAFAKKGFCNYHYAHQYHSNKEKSYNSINQKSEKQTNIDGRVAQIKLELINNLGMVCQGCGRQINSRKNLELSHLIRRSKRLDLVTNKRNCTLHGRYCCHKKWDSNVITEMASLNDFWVNLEAIKALDKSRYNQLIIKLDETKITFPS